MKRDNFTLPLALGPESGVQLDAVHLFANWGFGDGEMLEEHPAFLAAVQATGVEANAREVLADLIERYLLPALPASLHTYRLESTLHNPVRADDSELHRRSEFADFGVTIPTERIVDLLRARAPRRAAPPRAPASWPTSRTSA